MKTKKLKITKKNQWILLVTAAMLFVYAPSIAGKKKIPERQKQVPVSENIDKPNDTSKTESGMQKCKKTTILKWDPERNCWEPWRCNEVNTCSENESTEKAYTKIKIWNCEINDWEPYSLY